jgi:hypothetical protein
MQAVRKAIDAGRIKVGADDLIKFEQADTRGRLP